MVILSVGKNRHARDYAPRDHARDHAHTGQSDTVHKNPADSVVSQDTYLWVKLRDDKAACYRSYYIEIEELERCEKLYGRESGQL
jgi:hypothetical protein